MKHLIKKGLFLTLALTALPSLPTAEQDPLIPLLTVYLDRVSLKAAILKELPSVLVLVSKQELPGITWAHQQLLKNTQLQDLRTKLLGIKGHVSETIVLRIPKAKSELPEIAKLSSEIHRKRLEIVQRLAHDNFLIAQALDVLNKS